VTCWKSGEGTGSQAWPTVSGACQQALRPVPPYSSLEEIDERTARQIQQRYFRRSFADIWAETADYLRGTDPAEIDRAEHEPKRKMALVFKWYFVHSTRLAMAGRTGAAVDYQIQCGPAMGALNSLCTARTGNSGATGHVDDLASC